MHRNIIEFEKMEEEKDGRKIERKESIYNKHVSSVLGRFTEKTSMHGCGYIKSSRHLVSKFLWILLTVLAIITLIIHLYMITDQFIRWPKKTTVSLEFNNLPFPAITICNVNSLKNSAVSKYGNKELQALVKAVAPKTILGKLHPDIFNNKNTSVKNSTDVNKRPKRSVSELYDLDWSRFRQDLGTPSIDGFSDGRDDRASLSILKEVFHHLYMALPKSEREFAGHNMDDMLLECMFSGKTCRAGDFKLYQTASYGNCYTLDLDEMYVNRPGPDGGLYLLLYLQTNEFIPGITNGYGVKVVVNDRGTVPLPDDDGVYVAANSETDISMKRTAITRLGSPHGKCETGTKFKEMFGANYSVKACHEACQAIYIFETCGCWLYIHEPISVIFNKSFTICNTTSDRLCEKNVMQTLYDKKVKCDCENPCNDVQYSLSISARQWPSNSYLDILKEVVCRSSVHDCKSMMTMTNNQELGKNFLLLNIYYETLNFESIVEEPLIDPFTFMSSIGGALGLWIGLSMLSVCEILQLAVELVMCLMASLKHLKSPT